MPKRNYIGLSCTYHDQALAIVDDTGTVRFAEGTERHLQYKRAANCTPDVLCRAPRAELETASFMEEQP